MKHTIYILCFLSLWLLISCTPWIDTQPNAENTSNENTVIESNPIIPEETGTVTLELQNIAPLAGETLNFKVVVESIEKWEGNTASETVENGDNIEVNYIGTLENGEEFDSSYTRNQTLAFPVGAGQMIPGFDAGVVGMKLGEEKNLILPPEEAYGPAIIRETVPTAELRQFVGPDFEISVGASIPTAGWEATIVELQD